MKKQLMVYGCGKLGQSILSGLAKMGVRLFCFSYNSPGGKTLDLKFGNQKVYIKNSSDLKKDLELGNMTFKKMSNLLSYIIVTLRGDVLEEEIDFLLEFRVPLIICSTGYNKQLITKKAKTKKVTVVMSENMVLAIVDFWNRILQLPPAPKSMIKVFLIESHQAEKGDISGSGITALGLFTQKGFCVDFDKSLVHYVPKKDGTCGCITWLREKSSQISHGVPKEFIGGHGYHIFTIRCTKKTSETDLYIKNMYDKLKSLSNGSIEGLFNFEVILNSRGITIIHNINGREIYPYGVYECMKFLNKVKIGVYSGIDVVKSIETG